MSIGVLLSNPYLLLIVGAREVWNVLDVIVGVGLLLSVGQDNGSANE
jgi:hypothetical protein